jgi:hypothetical protein
VIAAGTSTTTLSSLTSDDVPQRNIGGRPIGSSKSVRSLMTEIKEKASTECAKRYKEAQDLERSKYDRCKKGTLSELIKKVESEYNLREGTIKNDTIVKRVFRNNLTGYRYQCTSPVAKMEPVLVDYCKRLCRIGKALDQPQVLKLANSLIEANGYESKIIQ